MENPPRIPGNTPGARSDNMGMDSEASAPYVWNERFPRMGLAANAQLQKNRFVALWARISQVSQKPSTLGNQGQQPFAGAMILLVRLEMLRKHRDSGAQQGNLYFWRPGVGFVALIPGENLLLCFNRQCHSRGNAPCLLLISFMVLHQNTTGTIGRGVSAPRGKFQYTTFSAGSKHLETVHRVRPLGAQPVLAGFQALLHLQAEEFVRIQTRQFHADRPGLLLR